MSVMDASVARPTSLIETVRLIEVEQTDNDLRVLARVTVDPDNPILRGHYPGMPIFPGICLIECADLTVVTAARKCGALLTLQAVPTARFRSPVLPGHTVDIQALTLRTEDQWRAAVTMHGPLGLAARVTLRYTCAGAS